jgi:alpha-methylacyl-CoA racemase
MKPRLAEIFRKRTRDEWCALLEGTDVCFAPVLSLSEAPFHPHNQARRAFVDMEGQLQNAPAPRFSGTPTSRPQHAEKGLQAVTALAERWGLPSSAIEKLVGASGL